MSQSAIRLSKANNNKIKEDEDRWGKGKERSYINGRRVKEEKGKERERKKGREKKKERRKGEGERRKWTTLSSPFHTYRRVWFDFFRLTWLRICPNLSVPVYSYLSQALPWGGWVLFYHKRYSAGLHSLLFTLNKAELIKPLH